MVCRCPVRTQTKCPKRSSRSLLLLFILLHFGITSPALAQTIPWVLPWNDATPGVVTDFSSQNAPIGTNRVAVDTNAHFVVNGARVRFLGVNFAGDSPFMPTNKAEGVAARLAKFGINNVRFHHMDASWAYNGGLLRYVNNTSTNFNATNLERLHFLVARLKAHGVYSDINLLVGRDYQTADGLGPEVGAMDSKDEHILGFFYDPALALHKDYATKLLTPTNRFTGLPLAKDPAVALVEIINENGILQKWLDGGLDRLPAAYRNALQARWNQWLAARYTNDAAMLAAWNVIDQPLGTNLLENGSFTNGIVSWNPEQHPTATATFARTFDFTNAGPSAKITVTSPDTTSWHIQFNQANLRLTSNQAYTVSFWAKSSPATNADVSVMRAHTDYISLGYARSLALTTNWQLFTNTFQASKTETNARVNFGSMGDKLATFWFADVRLQAGGQIGLLPAGTSLAGRTVPNLIYSGSGYTGTLEARKDWIRFLRDLEYGYYDTMVSHLRTNIGYTGLIFGTIMANSPASVQSRLDVIDGHAYWQHPQFPGQPWDPVNWFLPNISMVNTLGDGSTLAGLARQRIKGKPFTVTEYQHPSPNYYGAEGPLLIAAYGGLQDWDGLWLFDYGPGQDGSATMGYVRGFFEIGQHSTKMANLLLAANLFRRGDVRPANQEISMALNLEKEVDLAVNTYAWNLFDSGQLGVPAKLAFTTRLSTSVGQNPPGLTSPPPGPSGNILSSDTGELKWDAAVTNQSLVTFNTARTKGLVGFADNKTINLGGISFRPGTTRLGWASLGATLVRGEVFTNDCSALIVATGWFENTNQVWKSPAKDSVGNQWGGPPFLTEVVPFTLTIPVGTNYVHAWSLDERGQRKAALTISGDATNSILSVNTNAGTIWYELRVDRWMASFDLWRARYFSSAELASNNVSGEAAAPDGDRVPNLLKYFVGLPGRTPAPPDRLPSGATLSVSNQLFLSFTYLRDKLASDVACIPEVSPDLVAWFSGPAYSRVEQVAELGDLEGVTVRSLAPIGSPPGAYMRLRFQRQ